MTGGTLIKRSLRFFWRTHLSVVLAAAVSTAVLVGALTVGDSVRGSLRALALARLGRVHHALAGGDRYFRAPIAEDIRAALKAPVAPVLLLNGSVSNGDGTARVSRAAVVGADERFWSFGAEESVFGGSEEEVVLNERLAERLGA
ncbi:MAG: hypothetical protein QF662_02105, partial [Phycisphaerae bacterium]|nr:hypothetical protein [Phycisphaerae bacterium]